MISLQVKFSNRKASSLHIQTEIQSRTELIMLSLMVFWSRLLKIQKVSVRLKTIQTNTAASKIKIQVLFVLLVSKGKLTNRFLICRKILRSG